MKPKTMVLMVVAIGCGLGASYMTSRLLADRQNQAPLETVAVLVAKKNLDLGTPLKDATELFEYKEYTKGQEPKDAVIDYAEMKDKFLKRSLRRGDFITPADLQMEWGCLPDLPQGMVAVGLRVNSETTAAGFASLPGSHVDILSTIRRGTDDDTHCQILLENVLVLAADAQARRPDDPQAMPANVVTVALTREQAMRVTLAKELGTLTLVLRKFGDNKMSETEKVTASDVFNGRSDAGGSRDVEDVVRGTKVKAPAVPTIPEAPLVQPVPAAAPKPKLWTVRIQEGNNVRRVAFRLNAGGKVAENQDGVEGEQSAPPPPPALAAPAEEPEELPLEEAPAPAVDPRPKA